MKIKKEQKLITIDLETHPAEVLMYGNTWEPVIVKIIRFQSILSMAYKINDGKTQYIALNKIKGYKSGDLDDKKLLIEITKILKDADVIIGQNSDEFDIKIIKERIMFHSLPALPDEIITYDTKKLYKKVSRLPNNKLDTIGQFTGLGQKIKHEGVDLFISCGAGNEKAWKVNEKYNKQDVDLCYSILKRVLPYVTLTARQSSLSSLGECSNPLCKSTSLIKSKLRKVVGGHRQQCQCTDCGKYTTLKKLIKD